MKREEPGERHGRKVIAIASIKSVADYRWFPMLSYAGVVFCAMLAAGAGELLGDEVTFWRAAHGSYLASFPQTGFYRLLGPPVQYLAFDASRGYPWALTVLAAILTAITIWWFVSVFASGFDRKLETSATLLAGLFVLALPFSMYGILIRVVFSQLAAIALMAAACAAAFAYMKLTSRDRRGRSYRLVLGSLAYTLSLFTYEIALLTPFVIAAIIVGSRSSTEDRKNSLKAWALALALPLVLYLSLQVPVLSSHPKLAPGIQAHIVSRAEASLIDQAFGKATTFLTYVRWAWQETGAGIARGDWHALMVAPAMGLAGIGAGTRLVLSMDDDSVANALCFVGGMIFMSTMSLWGFYWLRDHVLTTPPLYSTLLPNCGLALVALGLVRRRLSARAANVRRVFVIGLVIAGVGTNVAVLNANRLVKAEYVGSKAEAVLLSGQR